MDRSPFARLFLGPFLLQAGYEVTVAGSPAEAMALYARGEAFDLILADTSGEDARSAASTLAAAVDWHTTPLMGLSEYAPTGAKPEKGASLSAVTNAAELEPMRGAA